MQPLHPRAEDRRGFTIVELLVVIAIIAILAALVAAASMRMLGQTPQKNTEILIQKIKPVLEAQWKAVIDQARREDVNTYNPNAGTDLWPTLLTTAGNDSELALQYYVQARLVQEFPQNFREALTPSANGITLAPKQVYKSKLGGAAPSLKNSASVSNGTGNTAGGNLSYESGCCLYLILSVARGGINFDVGNFSPREATNNPGPNGQTNFFCVLDGWGQPLQYQRFTISVTDDNRVESAVSRSMMKFRLVSAGPDRILQTANGTDTPSSGGVYVQPAGVDDINSDVLRLSQ